MWITAQKLSNTKKKSKLLSEPHSTPPVAVQAQILECSTLWRLFLKLLKRLDRIARSAACDWIVSMV